MQVALSSIDGIKILNDPELQADKTRAMWFIGQHGWPCGDGRFNAAAV